MRYAKGGDRSDPMQPRCLKVQTPNFKLQKRRRDTMRKHLFLMLSWLIAASVVLAACGPAATPSPTATSAPPTATQPPPTAMPVPPTQTPAGPPDLTGETITIYHFGDLSGPLAAITAPLIQ